MLFRANEPHKLGRRIIDAEYVLRRGVPEEVGCIRFFDTRDAMRYRLPSGRQVWLPAPIESSDTFGGYVGRGAPGPGQVVWDVGAFCGETVVEFSRLVGPAGHVFALEPDPANRELLRRNLEMHGARNVTVLPYALWGEDGVLKFTAAGDCESALTGFCGVRPGAAREIAVEAVGPVSLLAKAGRAPDFIKMDIEGAEVEALAALAPVLAKLGRAVRLAVASYHVREGRPTHELITGPLRAAGFTVETGNAEHVTTWAWHEGR
jgi:FkbM family methyltransferase